MKDQIGACTIDYDHKSKTRIYDCPSVNLVMQGTKISITERKPPQVEKTIYGGVEKTWQDPNTVISVTLNPQGKEIFIGEYASAIGVSHHGYQKGNEPWYYRRLNNADD